MNEDLTDFQQKLVDLVRGNPSGVHQEDLIRACDGKSPALVTYELRHLCNEKEVLHSVGGDGNRTFFLIDES